MSNELTVTNNNMDFDTMQRMSLALYKSGYFKDSQNEAQAIVKVMAGHELGLPPFASMSGIHIIQGKPALGSNVIATLIKNDPRYNYRVKELSDKVCTIEFYEDGQPCGESVFTAQDAQKAGVKNMNKFPRNMLFARAISNGAKWFTPGIFGGAPVYTPAELGADVDEDGYIVDNGVKWEELPSMNTPDEVIIEAEPVKKTAVSDDQRKPTAAMMKALHAAGKGFYGDDWDNQRAILVKAVTKDRTSSSKHLTFSECKTLIDGINKKANG